MKNLHFSLLLAAFMIFIASCQKPEQGGDEQGGKTPLLESVTIDVDLKSSSATAVVFSSDINLGGASSMPLNVFMRYSLSESMTGDDVKTVKLKAGASEVKLTGLVFGRDYYYETYVELYETEYNKVRNSFKTQNLEVEMNEPELTLHDVRFTGKLKGYGTDDKGEISLAMVIAEADGYEQTHKAEIADDGSYAVTVSGLDIATQYQYKGVVSQGELKTVEGSAKTLTTSDPYKDAVKTFASATDLASAGTANCYIVSAPGDYKFPAVKGNSNTSVGAVSAVRILWESFGTSVAPSPKDLISAAGYKDGYAYIEVPQGGSSIKEGNAVVAAYDAAGKILWSWHIWLTNDTVKEITYANQAGVMMDRNLGALSSDVNSAEALGLFYQWGRKDPFLGSSSVSQPLYAAATRHLKITVNSDVTSNVAFATANPHMFILGNANGDWLASKDNGLWASSKTVYDPCPAGWRVPDGGYNGGLGESAMKDGIWAKAGISRQGLTPFASGDSNKLGKVFTAPFCTPETWYPAAGSIEQKTGTLYELAVDGIYHSTSAFAGEDAYVTGLLFNYLPSSGGHYIYCGGEKFTRAGGASLRCCKE